MMGLLGLRSACAALCVASVMVAANAWAQPSVTPSGKDSPAAKPAAPAGLPSLPPVDERAALAGAALLQALRQGGYVFYVRHTETGVVTADCVASNLSPAGEEMARQLGNAWRELKLPIAEVISSEVCRVRDTARLMGFAVTKTNEDLNNMPKSTAHDIHMRRAALIATPPPKGSNVVLVSHIQGGDKPEQRLFLEFGETIVFKPDGAGGVSVVARVKANAWRDLAGAVN